MNKIKTAILIIAIATLAACGGSGTSSKPDQMNSWGSLTHSLWMLQCTTGDNAMDRGTCECAYGWGRDNYTTYDDFIADDNVDRIVSACI